MTAITLEGGESANTESFDGANLSFVGPRAFAPGAPIRFVAMLDTETRSFEGRSLGSRRTADGFLVRMRFVNLTRRDREALAAVHEAPEAAPR